MAVVEQSVVYEQEYVLELVRGTAERLERAFALPNVSSYTREPEPATDVVWSIRQDAKARPIKQASGYVEERISIQGMSGEEERSRLLVEARPDQSFSTTSVMYGVAYFEAFLAFLKDYEDDAARYRSASRRDPVNAPQLIFRALKEGLAWYVDRVKPVVPRRVGSSRHSYEYTLTMVTEGVAKARPYGDLVADPARALPIAETGASEALKQAAGPRRRADLIRSSATGDVSAQTLRRAIARIPGDLAQLRAPVDTFARQAAEAVELVEEAVRAGSGFPREVAASIKIYADRAAKSVYRIWDEMAVPLRDRARGVRDELRTAIGSVRRAVQRLLGTAGTKLAPPGDQQLVLGGSRAQARAGRFVRVIRILDGEDLAAVAQRVLGTPGRWEELLELNGMPSAWELSDGRPLEAGAVLYAPVDDVDIDRRPDADPADALGTDWRWDFRRQDIVAEGDAATDFARVSGLPNLRQACLRRGTTPQGRVRVFPQMGMPFALGQNATDEGAALFASQAVTQFGADPRIKAVRNVEVVRYANILRARLGVVAVTGDTFSLANLAPSLEA